MKNIKQYNIFLWLTYFITGNIATAATSETSKPNFIVYLVDDMGYGELNNPNFKTPNLQKFAQQSMILDYTYTAPVCAPSRRAALTGNDMQILGNQVDGTIPLPNITLPGELQKQGYYTGIIGKYGDGDAASVSSAAKVGFNYSVVFTSHIAAHTYFPYTLEKNGKTIYFKNNRRASQRLCQKKRKPCSYSSDILLQESMQFLDQNVNNNFLLWWAPTTPHVGIYRNNEKRYTSPVPEYTGYPKRGVTVQQRGHQAMFNYIDRDIGELMAKLDELGISNKTLVLFVSDNGAVDLFNFVNKFNANGNLKGSKSHVYEGGIRVPAMVRWPGTIKPNHVNNIPWKLQYLLATFTDLAGKKVTTAGSVSAAPYWLDEAKSKPVEYMEITFCNGNKEPCQYVLFDYTNWPRSSMKLLKDTNDIELYNLTADSREQVNLVQSPCYAEMTDKLTTKRKASLPQLHG